jgi:hypothetical protein
MSFPAISLQKLRFSGNRYRFDKKIHNDSKQIEIFHFLPNIKELHLAQNYLPKDDNILRQMFEHLTNLRKINLHSTYISLVPEVLNTLTFGIGTSIISGPFGCHLLCQIC